MNVTVQPDRRFLLIQGLGELARELVGRRTHVGTNGAEQLRGPREPVRGETLEPTQAGRRDSAVKGGERRSESREVSCPGGVALQHQGPTVDRLDRDRAVDSVVRERSWRPQVAAGHVQRAVQPAQQLEAGQAAVVLGRRVDLHVGERSSAPVHAARRGRLLWDIRHQLRAAWPAHQAGEAAARAA